MFGFFLFTMGLLSFLPCSCSPAKLRAVKPQADAAGRSLRQRLLMSGWAEPEAGAGPTAELPRVHGILMDLPISGGQTATVVATASGVAGLDTTGDFGICGQEGDAAVCAAARRFILAAEAVHDAAVPVATEFPCPAPGRVRFYLLTYAGVRCIEAEMAGLADPQGACSALFRAGQALLTALRLTMETKPVAAAEVPEG